MSKINETNYPRRPQSDYEDTDMLIIQEAGGNTYTTRIEDIREDCQETIAPTVEAVNDALAPPENGSTASQSYAIGEHFMRNGDFCTAIAAITSGASFTLNTNYVVGTIAEALESLTSELTNYAIKKATSGAVALANATQYVMVVGKGTVKSVVDVGATIMIPMLALNSTPRYYQTSDSYNGELSIHLQAEVTNTQINNAHMYYGANIIANEVIEFYYV